MCPLYLTKIPNHKSSVSFVLVDLDLAEENKAETGQGYQWKMAEVGKLAKLVVDPAFPVEILAFPGEALAFPVEILAFPGEALAFPVGIQ